MTEEPTNEDDMLKTVLAWLTMGGMSVKDIDYPTLFGVIPVIAQDKDELVHVFYSSRSDDHWQLDSPASRQAMAQMECYLQETHRMNAVRFDRIQLRQLDEDKLLLRHQRAVGRIPAGGVR